MKRVTATEAARNFSRLLDDAEHRSESFVVERNGRPVAEVRPAGAHSTVEDLLEILRMEAPDDDFEADMREVVADRDRHLPADRWGTGG
ncbi:MAG: Antitoxin Phd YefM, type toxin-antitoxin system [Solirubrobacteraceae bacterium]|jgi:antitoxin (DNA-binding transcriptional repressor) of toxin-antitoxin stability system|nr:Antitoxin Phd YefM, type toxin-antitoxin system [Solirubrobacteraceae bacterium]